MCYRVSPDALRRFGHGPIIDALKLILNHETGAVRQYNVDAVPIPGNIEQLCIVRSVATGEIVAVGESEYRMRFGWTMPSSPSIAH